MQTTMTTPRQLDAAAIENPDGITVLPPRFARAVDETLTTQVVAALAADLRFAPTAQPIRHVSGNTYVLALHTNYAVLPHDLRCFMVQAAGVVYQHADRDYQRWTKNVPAYLVFVTVAQPVAAVRFVSETCGSPLWMLDGRE